MAGNFIKVGKWGECLWGIDENGNLLIDSGLATDLGDEGAPWKGFEDAIRSAVATNGVSFPDGASLAGLFKGCRKMAKADLSGFDTSNVTRMDSMFAGCASLRELDISSFDTHRCTDMEKMFAQCAKLDDILLGDGFSVEGDGSTSCGRLAVKEYGKYKKGKPFSVEGFSVFYHSNFEGEAAELVEERQTIPNVDYVIEAPMFDKPDDSWSFMGWNTRADASGTTISVQDALHEVDRNIDLYAVWGHTPKIGEVTEPAAFTYGEAIPFELPEIISVNDPEVTGFLEISETGEEGTWKAIKHDAILPVSCDGYLLRLHASNSIGEAVSNAVRLNIKRANIDVSGVRWAEEDDMTYNGSTKHVWLEGLPEGVVPKYIGNEGVEAGTYTATISFDFDQDNFNEPLIVREHEWTIRKGSYDMSQVSWVYDGPFIYDGCEHGVSLKGLPEGVSAHYEDNSALKAGVYTAKAKFDYDSSNYEKPQDAAPCVWEIKKVALDAAALEWSGCEDFVYDGEPKKVFIMNLPEDAEVEYDGAEETQAGKYLARASIGSNYCFSGPAEYEWEIAKASYDMSGTAWSEATEFEYDGETHSVQLASYPEALGVRYSGCEGRRAGEYMARASFVNPDTHNFNTPEDMTLGWRIGKKSLDMSGVKWNYSGAFTYDGEIKTVELEGLPEGVYAEYENASAYDAGIYNAHANLKFDGDNLEVAAPADCTWRIVKRRLDVSDVCWDYSEPFEYDGNEHGIYLINVPDGVEVEYSDNTSIEAGKYAASAKLVPTDANNYEVPEVNGCAWSIDKAEYKLPQLFWTDSTSFIYDGSEKSVGIINDLGDAVNVEYTGNTAKGAGRYFARAVFEPVDSDNYKAPAPLGYSWSIGKAQFDMSGVYWDYSEPYVYDGTPKTVKVAGLPEGVYAEYVNAEATDAGSYTSTAKFRVMDADNYEDNIPDMMLDWSIDKAAFDMSDVRWQENRTFSYDGETKTVRLTGLPEGLTPEYEGNSAYAAGEYTARAGFEYDVNNYRKPEVATCHWVIERTPVDISTVNWDYDEAFVYDGTVKTVAARNIPEGTTVKYNNATANQAGTYVAAAEIIPDDTDNLTKSRLENLTWRIDKGNYDMSHVRWDYEKPFTYDGSEFRVVLKGLPEGALPTYRGNAARDAGTYKASVTFTASDSRNFNTPEPMELEWTIRKADYDMSGASWDYEGEFKYNGRMHEVSLRGLPDGVRPVYSGNAAADTGSYEAFAELIPYDSFNYNQPVIESCKWQIVKADYDMSLVRWDYNRPKVFNGREQSVMLEQLPNGIKAYYSGNEGKEAGRYTAKAMLSVNDPANYNTPSVADCDWEIEKADYDMSAASWGYEPGCFTYDGGRKTIELSGLPENVTASYNENSADRAGRYTATANFATSDSNFKAPDPIKIDWCIEKADYDMSRAEWDYDGSFVFDGTPKRIQLTGIPEGVSVSYEGNTAVNAGTYTAVARFGIDTSDFNVPEEMVCEWAIEKADPDIRSLRWDYSQSFLYDGETKTVRLMGVPASLNVEYTGDTATAAGTYTAHAELMPKDPANYNGTSIRDCEWSIIKARYDMSGARWEGAFESVYDGSEKSVYIAGLPDGVTPVYKGNTAVNVGEYSASVDFEYDAANYHEPTMGGCEWSISKASYDMSKAAWQGVTGFTFDGTPKTVELVGLPEGVTPVYAGNTATDAGSYEASVSLEYDAENYEKPSFGGCNWSIAPAAVEVDTDAVEWVYDGPWVYDGTPKSVCIATKTEVPGFFQKLRGAEPRTYLAGIPEGFDVVYSGETATDAGVYYTTAKLVNREPGNYTERELPPFKWEILKKPIDMSGVHWNYEGPFTFDNEEKCVELAGLPDTVKVTYTDNRAVNSGEYEAMAVVEAKDPVNYEAPAPVSGCWWHIDKSHYDMSQVHWDYDEDFVYNGKEKSVKLVGLPEGVRVEAYVGNKGVDAGGYTAEARLRYKHKDNFEAPSVPELRWRIVKKPLDVSGVKWDYDDSTTFVYDEKAKEVKLEGVPEGIEVVYTDNCKINAGTYTARARLIYDTRNCEAIEIPDLKWTIHKSSYDTSAVRWDYDEPFEYDGTEKHITLKGVPWQIAVRYRDNRAIAPGKYTAKAYLTYDNDNYETPEIETTIDWEITGKE
ncbi:MAG: BspA family leucine-rich repeat surface protein [Mogibacterium sp.]|nr:BspA family leucine-rich repeat surface protein [Mogibacterium sp.]